MLTEHDHVEKFLSAISTEDNSSISLNEPEKWKSTWLLDDFDSEKWRLKKHESYKDKKQKNGRKF